MTVINDLKTLYKTDDIQWLEYTIELLRSKRLNELDLDNLIEELEDLGNERRSAVESLLEQVIRHLLLCQYWQAEAEINGNHWRAEIIGFRNQLERRLTTNLRNHLMIQLPKIYQSALKTGFKVDFPQQCPYQLEELLDLDWLPF
jgi:hypothetical protein